MHVIGNLLSIRFAHALLPSLFFFFPSQQILFPFSRSFHFTLPLLSSFLYFFCLSCLFTFFLFVVPCLSFCFFAFTSSSTPKHMYIISPFVSSPCLLTSVWNAQTNHQDSYYLSSLTLMFVCSFIRLLSFLVRRKMQLLFLFSSCILFGCKVRAF